MDYELIEDEEEIMEKVNAVDLDDLLEKMGEVEIDSKSKIMALMYQIMESDGDTIYQLELKLREDGVAIFAKQECYNAYEEDEYEDFSDQIHTFLGGERWLNLYKLLVKEVNQLREIDVYFDETTCIIRNSNGMMPIINSIVALAIFKEFANGVGEEESNSPIFELGYKSVYEMIAENVYQAVEITEE